jgi:3-methyladenine DNA glycosylase AlkC
VNRADGRAPQDILFTRAGSSSSRGSRARASGLPVSRFVKQACTGLEALELLDRGRHITRALETCLPESYPDAIDVLLRSLGPERASDELIGAGMAPFFYCPHTLFVAQRGLGHFDLSLQAQYELTKRFSAESRIRSYIARDPERVFSVLRSWARDANAHVRRLVSEGTRLRLPWAPRVAWLDANPERVLQLLEQLKDDVSATSWSRTAAAWLADGSPERKSLIGHALRSAVKRGDADMLGLLGYGAKPAVRLEKVTFAPARVSIGGRVAMQFTLRSRSSSPQELLVDVAVHFVKARGVATAKVFKVTRLALAPRQRVALTTGFSLAVHTTRVPWPRRHAVDVIVNGHVMPAGSFRVVASPVAR